MKRLEKSIEGAVVRWAKAMELEVVKLNGMGKRSHPDRMFLGPGEKVLFIEFKREGEEPTPLQLHLHQQWAKLGHKVWVVDNVQQGKDLIYEKLLVEGAKKWLTQPSRSRSTKKASKKRSAY